VNADEARAFISSNHRAVLATLRADGTPQLVPVTAAVDAEGRVIVSTTEPSVKVRNLRRNPHAALCVMNDGFFGAWAHVEGTVEIVELPEAMELLVDYYRRVSGEHPDWDDYRAAMERDRRVLLRISIQRAGPSGG
jgi:PPOX class probable F420-dependent enzyme